MKGARRRHIVRDILLALSAGNLRVAVVRLFACNIHINGVLFLAICAVVGYYFSLLSGGVNRTTLSPTAHARAHRDQFTMYRDMGTGLTIFTLRSAPVMIFAACEVEHARTSDTPTQKRCCSMTRMFSRIRRADALDDVCRRRVLRRTFSSIK